MSSTAGSRPPENLADELHELQIAQRELDSVVSEELLGVGEDGVQQHPAVAGQDGIGALEEQWIALDFEGLERADADDAVDGLVELLPAPHPDLDLAIGVEFGQPLPGEFGLRLAQGNADDVHVEFLDRAL